MQRQAYIRKFGIDSVNGGPFTDEDLDYALEELSVEEIQIKRNLMEYEILSNDRIADLEELVVEYIEDIQFGLQWLDGDTTTVEEASDQFRERREIVTSLINKVILRKSREFEIIFALDLAPLLQIKSQEY